MNKLKLNYKVNIKTIKNILKTYLQPKSYLQQLLLYLQKKNVLKTGCLLRLGREDIPQLRSSIRKGFLAILTLLERKPKICLSNMKTVKVAL